MGRQCELLDEVTHIHELFHLFLLDPRFELSLLCGSQVT